MKYVLPLVAAILPFALFPIELFLPYPYLVEEVAKAVLVLFLVREGVKTKEGLVFSIIFGVLFALSETVLYIFNIHSVGNIGVLLLRFAVTAPLHAFTTAVIFIFTSTNKKFFLLGLLIAIVLHFLFNTLVPFLIV